MRVLVVTNDLPPRVGGIQYYVDQLVRGLVDAGDRVTVLGSRSPGWESHDAGAPYRVVRRDTTTLLPTPGVRRQVLDLVGETAAEVVVFGAAFPWACSRRPSSDPPGCRASASRTVSRSPRRGPGSVVGCCGGSGPGRRR